MSDLIAEIFEIEEIIPHTNADRLEIVIFKGWRVVVQKDKFKIGDIAVYIPINCIMPLELSDHIGVTKYLTAHNRVRAASIRSEKSFGIVEKLENVLKNTSNKNIGDNIAEELGLIKYEIEDCQPMHHGNKKRYAVKPWKIIPTLKYIFSSWHNILDRIKVVQSKPWLKGFPAPSFDLALPGYPEFKKYFDMYNLRYFPKALNGHEVVVTEKIHGKNQRIGYINNKFLVGSHGVNRIQYEKDEFWQASKIYPLKDILKNGMILYGELYGKDVQRTMEYGLDKKQIIFFDLMIDGEYVDYDVFQDFCIKNNLPYAPYIYRGPYNYNLIQSLGTGCSHLTNQHIKEGVVVKTAKETKTPNFGRMVFKYINEDYLIGDYDGFDH